MVLGDQRLDVTGAAATVVNVLVALTARALPATSLTPLAPPTTTIVYVVELAKAKVGVSVAVLLLALYETVAATAVLPFINRIVLLLTVATLNASLKVIDTAVPVATFVDVLAGVKPITVGGVVSGTTVKLAVAFATRAMPLVFFTPLAPPTTTIV
jgi:hypothetical protein